MKGLRFLLLPPALALFAWFFVVYVPLVRGYLAILVPLLVLTAITAALDRKKGLWAFILLFPLINGLPYFYGITDHVPHAPAALVLFLAFFLGSLVNGALSGSGPERGSSLGLLMGGISLAVLVSTAVTVLRYADFAPFAAPAVRELVVNLNGVRAGGAIMSAVFNALNYLTGFGVYFIAAKTLRSRKDVRTTVCLLALSVGASLVFALVQRYHAIALGNIPFWVELRQINGTFKDPNSFAAFLSASIPLFIGAALSFRKGFRIAFLGLTLLCLIVFPSIGSRSGFAAILISVAALTLFGFKRLGDRLGTRLVPAGLALVGIGLILGGVLVAGRNSILGQRLKVTRSFLSRGILDRDFFNMRLQLWSGALRMMRDYPLTGVGVGAYIVEYPNVVPARESGRDRTTDSALNYFLQAGAELGGIGLVLVLWLFLEILRRMRSVLLLARQETENGPLLMGAVAAIAALFVNFQLHSYIGSYEVIYLFWILVAIVSFAVRGGDVPEWRRPTPGKIPAGSLILILLFGGVHVWNSSRSLSIPEEAERYGWDQDFGFYPEEKDGTGKGFRWMRRSAGLSLPVDGNALSFELLASHPDLAERPVHTRIFLADRHFRKTGLLKEALFDRSEWSVVKLEVPGGTTPRIHLVFETDRDWRPREALGVADPRSLAIAMKGPPHDRGRVRFP